jgi:hypothetical protein
MSVTVWAAQDTARSSAVPDFYHPLRQWVGFLQGITIVVGLVTMVARWVNPSHGIAAAVAWAGMHRLGCGDLAPYGDPRFGRSRRSGFHHADRDGLVLLAKKWQPVVAMLTCRIKSVRLLVRPSCHDRSACCLEWAGRCAGGPIAPS